jgi:hypothetical protein
MSLKEQNTKPYSTLEILPGPSVIYITHRMLPSLASSTIKTVWIISKARMLGVPPRRSGNYPKTLYLTLEIPKYFIIIQPIGMARTGIWEPVVRLRNAERPSPMPNLGAVE